MPILFSLLTVPPLLIVTGAVGLTLTQTALLAANQLRLKPLVLSLAVIVGLTLLFLWRLVYSGPIFSASVLNNTSLFYLNNGLKPLFLSLLLVGLLVNTITDLRERSVISLMAYLPIGGGLAILTANWLFHWSSNAAQGLIIGIIGVLICGLLTKFLALFSRVLSGERGQQVDEELAAAQPELDELRSSDFVLPFSALSLMTLIAGLAWANTSWLLLFAVWLALIPTLILALRPRRFSDSAPWQKALALRVRLPFFKGGAESGQNPPMNEDFGTGDLWTMVLIAVLLGPVNGFWALGLGILINAAVALPVFIYDRIKKSKALRYLPMVPSLTAATLIILLRF
jgi:hypothetical protein